jgi:predicted transposase/invertase (TIGR01784 family)
LSELKQTRVYQEARQEGLEEGLEQGQLQTKLEMVPWLLEVGISVEEIAQRLGLNIETIRQIAAEQTTSPE